MTKKPNYAFIDGKPYTGETVSTITVTSPVDKQTLTTLPNCGEADVNTAVINAKQVFEAGTWRDMPRAEKQAILYKFADLITENAERLATLESSDMGMPMGMCQFFNMAECAKSVRWYAEAIDKTYDQTSQDNGVFNVITHEPVGVVGIITPWNFPAMILGWKIAPALVLGNSVVVKPSEQASMATIAIAELAIEAGLPKGVFNVVTGLGPTAGKALASHKEVRVIAFTGSGATGGKLLEYAGQSNLKRVYLELGGKNANIILPDAPDMEQAVMVSTMVFFANAGQICASPSRLLVHKDIKDEFVTKITEVAKNLVVGSPFEQDTYVGPLASEAQYNKSLSYIDIAKKEGATCVLGGDTPDTLDGYYINPTIFTDVTPDMTIAKEEVFGPVLSVIPFETIDEAIAIANDTEYGLTASVWTQNLSTAHDVSSRLQAGTVYVNDIPMPDMSLPFGGVKQSGYGSDLSLHALDKYSSIKTRTFKLS